MEIITVVSNFFLNFRLYRVFGWKDINLPSESSVCVFGHSSYWDIFILWLYSCKNIYAVAKPQVQNYPFLSRLNLLYASKLEEKGGGSTRKLVEQFNKLKEITSTLLFISPKGTIQKNVWRSGYYWIAKESNVKIVPAFIDFSNRKIEFGIPIDPQKHSLENCNRYLQEQLGRFRVLNMENAEYNINDKKGCPYESLLPFDMCSVSLLAFVPYILCVLSKGWSIQIILSTMLFIVAMQYHLDHEGLYCSTDIKKYQKLELILSLITISSQICHSLYYKIHFTKLFYLSAFLHQYVFFWQFQEDNRRDQEDILYFILCITY